MNDRSRLRLIVLGLLVFSLPLTLLGRLWYMQALAGSQYAAALNKDNTSVVQTVAPRGIIVDDVGTPLARNDSALVVAALSTALPRANIGTVKNPKANPARTTEMQRLSTILGIPAAQLDAKATLCDYATYHDLAPQKNPGCWTGSPLQPIPLVTIDNSTPTGAQHATNVALQVLEQQELFPGVTAQIQAVRNYPAPGGASAAQLLGHVGKITQTDIDAAKTADEAAFLKTAAGVGGIVGQEGIEAQYNTYLQGTMGTRTVSISPNGNPIATVAETPATPGDAVVTSIDAKVQKIAEDALVAAANKARSVPQRISGKNKTVKADVGAAVVIDLRTGHVIAAANYPTYSPSLWDGVGIDPKAYDGLLKDPGKPLFSQAVQGQYAPGSTFKVITTAGAVTTPNYSLSGTYDCASQFKSGDRTFRNFEGESGQGKITFERALTISCDTFFYQIADTLWKADGGLSPTHAQDAIVNEAKLWGLGKSTGIDLPIDATGSVESRKDLVDTYNKNKALWCLQATTEPDPTIRAILRDNCNGAYKIYQVGYALNTAVGQGTVTLSPLQLAVAYGALGNGGTLFSPRIGKAIIGPDGSVVKTINAPSTKLQVPANVLSYERQALTTVVTDPKGTGFNAFAGFPFDRYTIGGKTGTAEVQSLNPDHSQKDDTAWFASFGGPVGQPAQYAVVVMMSQGGQGGVTAAPAVRQIYDGIWGLDGDPTNPTDKFAAKGPALPGGVPPAALPKLAQPGQPGAAAARSSSPAGSSPAGSSPKALAAPTGVLGRPNGDAVAALGRSSSRRRARR